MQCLNCRSVVNDDALYCPVCGASIKSESSDTGMVIDSRLAKPNQTINKKSNRKPILISVSAVALVVVLALGYYFYEQNRLAKIEAENAALLATWVDEANERIKLRNEHMKKANTFVVYMENSKDFISKLGIEYAATLTLKLSGSDNFFWFFLMGHHEDTKEFLKKSNDEFTLLKSSSSYKNKEFQILSNLFDDYMETFTDHFNRYLLINDNTDPNDFLTDAIMNPITNKEIVHLKETFTSFETFYNSTNTSFKTSEINSMFVEMKKFGEELAIQINSNGECESRCPIMADRMIVALGDAYLHPTLPDNYSAKQSIFNLSNLAMKVTNNEIGSEQFATEFNSEIDKLISKTSN